MRADPFVSPVARMAVLAMLAFTLTTAALLLHLGSTLNATPAVDRYADPLRQAKLARGMGWLKQALAAGADTSAPMTARECEAQASATLFDCRLVRLNQRLALADPPAHLSATAPDAATLPDVLAATHWLLQYSATPANLQALLQRGEDAATQSMPDPFRLSGCVMVAGAMPPCDAASNNAARVLLPHSGHLFNSLVQYAAATRGQSPNVRVLQANPGLDTPITQGRHVHLGLSPAVQDLAQTTAACFTGDTKACGHCTWCDSGAAADMYEQARARAVGILVLDARSGAIEAAASAYTACYSRQQLGEPPGPACPELPNTTTPHPDRLGNQALEQTAKPGSITKIVIALGLQQAGRGDAGPLPSRPLPPGGTARSAQGAALSSAETADLPRILTYSRTLELIDITMCRRQGFDPACARQRLLAVADMAVALGWDRHTDVLGAGQLPGLHAQRFSARLLSQPDGVRMVSAMRNVKLTRSALQACSNQLWHNCKGRDLVNLVAELFGTGEALASPIAVGNTLLHLAASANRQDKVPQAHLVATAQDNAGQMLAVQPVLLPVLKPVQSSPVLLGLERTATQGTARSACLSAAAVLPAGALPCVAASGETAGPAMRIAGKTGTPVFSADQGEKKSSSLAQWRAQCNAHRLELAALHAGQPRWYAVSNEAGKCNMFPTKWYAFLVGAPGGSGWDKAVVVLAERNWNRRTGLIDSPNDNGPNVAAEAGLSFANMLYYPRPMP